jgi:hypothetical protein
MVKLQKVIIKIIKKFSNFLKLRKQRSIYACIIYLFYKLKIINSFNDYFGRSDIHNVNFLKIKLKIFNKILNISNNRVISGLYKSTYLQNDKEISLSNNFFMSQLIGCYEAQVQQKIIDLQKKYGLINIINFGAGNGFHVLGLVKNNFFEKGFCFDIDPEKRKLLSLNIKKNKLKDKITVHNEASFNEVNALLTKNKIKKTLFLIDIEGSEFTLINRETIHFIKNSYLVIENHSFNFSKKKLINFWKIINYYYNYEIIDSSSRDPMSIKELDNLSEDEKWIAISENRPKMNWIICEPKNKS